MSAISIKERNELADKIMLKLIDGLLATQLTCSQEDRVPKALASLSYRIANEMIARKGSSL